MSQTGDIRECGEFESAGNGKTGPYRFNVVQERQKTKPAAFEFAEPSFSRKDGRLSARGRVNGIPVWRRAGPGDIKLARRSKKRWERRQRLIHKEPNQA